MVEIKSPTTPQTELNYITSNHVVPNRYLAQIQLQMFMTGKKRGYFCVASHDFEKSKKVNLVCIHFDEKYISHIIEKSMHFWKETIFPILFKAVKVN